MFAIVHDVFTKWIQDDDSATAAIFTVTVLGLAPIHEMCRCGGQHVGTLCAVTLAVIIQPMTAKVQVRIGAHRMKEIGCEQ